MTALFVLFVFSIVRLILFLMEKKEGQPKWIPICYLLVSGLSIVIFLLFMKPGFLKPIGLEVTALSNIVVTCVIIYLAILSGRFKTKFDLENQHGKIK